MFGSFFEQDHLLNLIILEIWSIIFFLTFTVRGPYHRKDFKWKKYGGTGLISEKTEALYAELNKRDEAATISYSVTG